MIRFPLQKGHESLVISTSLFTGSFARFFRLRWLRQARLTALLVRTKTLSRW